MFLFNMRLQIIDKVMKKVRSMNHKRMIIQLQERYKLFKTIQQFLIDYPSWLFTRNINFSVGFMVHSISSLLAYSFQTSLTTSTLRPSNHYIVSQMNFRSFEEMPRQYPERRSPDTNQPSQKYSTVNNKNAYIGLTLMEYFKLSHSKQGLQQIDEESNSSISAGTPCFADFKDQLSVYPQSKRKRREKARTQIEQDLLPGLKDQLDVPHSKISTINLEEATILDKNIVKLPAIHEHRHLNNSRQGMVKEGKIVGPKKESIFKFKNEQNSSLAKNAQIGRIHQIQKNPMVKKSLRARVTSTSFYHPSNKQRERERVKTEEEMPSKVLQKSFIVTKYGASFATKRSKEEGSFQAIKKQQNTFKLIKNTNT